jgi:alpha-tubulin suppressor-like RCC1 family protein
MPSLIVRSAVPALAPALLLAMLGCGQDTTSPAPDTPAAPALATTATLSFAQMSAGGAHTCGVTTSNIAYCWGYNGNGQLGDGSTTPHTRPVAVAGGLLFLRVSAGNGHTCGITKTNQAYCWGLNGDGQLGDGTQGTNRLTPVAVAGGRSYRQVSAGPSHTCAVTNADVAFCWGSNEMGKLGNPFSLTGFNRLTPLRVSGGLHFQQVIAGALHTCGATTGNQGYCWGANGNGELGNGTHTASSSPVPVSGGLSFRMVVAGGGLILIPSEEQERGYSCGLTIDNLAYCWGEQPVGVLSSTPVAVPGGRHFRGINLSFDHVCAVTPADVAFCWGQNEVGQLGDGTTMGRAAPTRVTGGLDFLAVTTNPFSRHSCGTTTGHLGYCWGLNQQGQLGVATSTGPELCGSNTPCSTKPVGVKSPT